MRKVKKILSITLCIVLLCALIPDFIVVPAEAASVSTTLIPAADQYYNSAFSMFFNIDSLGVNNVGTSSYIRNDISSIKGTVTSAKLRLFCVNNTGDSNVVLKKLADDAWTDTSQRVLTSGDTITTFTNVVNTWTEIDVTSYVASEVAGGDGNASFFFSSGSTNGTVSFSSKEGSNPPQLVVTYNAPPTMSSAVRNSDTQIAVNLSESCKNLANSGSGGFTVTQTGNPAITYAVSLTAQGVSDKQVVLTVADMSISAKEGVTVTYTAGSIQDIATSTNMATNSTGVNVAAWDTTAPAITTTSAVAANNAYVDVSVSEGVYASDNGTGGLTPSAFALTFTPNGGTATGVSISSVKKPDNALETSASALSGEETVVRVFLNITGTPSGIEIIVIKPANASAIYDKAGNAMLTTQTTGDKALNDQLPPTMLSAVRNNDTQITVTLSENCTDIAKPNSGGFTVAQTGTPTTPYAVTAIAQGTTANLVVLTVADMGVSGKEGVNVTYTAGGNGTVKDTSINTNAMATNSTGVAIAAWDTTPPAITTTSAVAANNAYIDVSMSEGVYASDNGTGGLNASDFALTFTPNGGTATGVSISSVKKPDNVLEASASALSGGESAVRVFLNITGTPSGIETIVIKPANASTIFDIAGNAVLSSQNTGVKTMKDKLPPTTTNAALNSNTKITLAVSEACTDIAKNNDGGFTIEQTGTPSITYAVNSVSEGSIILNTADMGVSAKEGVTVKYTPGGNGTIKDSAGNLMTSFTTTFAAWDTTPPAITTTSAVAANNAYVDVSVSEGVYASDNGTGGLTPSAFALTFTPNGGTATGVSISSVKKPDNALETSASVLSGEETVVRVFLNITGTPSGIETIAIKPANASAIYDKAGNAMPLGQTTGDKVLNDQLPPTMLSAARNSDTQITVTLSENCTDLAKTNSGGFTVAETSSPAISYAVTAIAQGATANQVVLTVADMGVSGKEGVNVTYTAGGNGTVKDTSVNANAMATNSTGVAIAAWDTTPPAISSGALAANNAYIDVSMSEGVYTADNGTGGLTPSDFTLTFTQNGGTATGVSISSVKKPDNALEASASALSGGESAVRVFLNITGTPSGIETIKINPANNSAIYDKAGNAMLATQTTGDKTLNDQLPPTMLSAARNSDTQITVTLSENCTDIAKANSGGFTVAETSSPTTSYAVTAIAQGATANQVVLTVADMGVSGKEGVNVTYTAGGNGTVKDTSVNANAMATNSTGVAIAAWDTTPPAISSGALAANNAYIDVSMSEGVYTADNGTGSLTPSDFALTFTPNGGTATGVSISSVKKPDNALETSASVLSGEETVVRVFLNITGTPSGIETIAIKPANASAIYDKAGNAMPLGQTTGDKVLNDQLPPTMLSAARNSDTQMTVTLSENCMDITKANDGGFTVEQTGLPSLKYAVTAITQGATANQVVLTVADMSFSGYLGVTLKYTLGGNGTIKDIAGNSMASFTTTLAAWDTTPPTMLSAVRNSNTQMTVTLSENCTDITKANDGGFTVEQTSSSALTYAVTAIAQGATANQVVLTVADMSASEKEGVTLKYTPGGNGTIKDIAGNSMASFSTTLAAWDTTPPTILSAVRNSNTQMTVTLSENCMDITKANDGGFTVEQTGLPSLKYAVTAITQGATANQVVLTVEDMSFSGYLGVTLKYTTGGNGTIKDGGGNLVASFTTAFSAWLTSNSGGGSTIKENDNKASVIIGGESHDDVMNVETGKTNDGRTEATITLNDKTKDVIDNKPDGTSFKITFPSDYDINNLVMIGDIVKKMEEKSIVLDITANSSTFALPAADIKIDDVAKSFGDNVALKDITVKITISTPDANMSTEITKKAEEGGFSIVAPAVDFAINCTYKNNTIAITEFDSYVQNTTKLPDGITPEKITTAIYTSKDGEFHHVPTKITIIDGVYYAVVNSMISGTFNFVYHFVSFPDVENHWSKTVVNDMASRFIVYGYENGLYVPDGDITRAEFATIVIRGMGLHDGLGQNTFSDISANDWYCGYVATACKYSLINGYSPESFGANEKITREQAITIIARAMKWTGIKVSLTDSEKDALLASFKDKTDISDYAKDSIAICIKSEIVVGRGETTDEGISESTIKPKAFLTRAEAAALVQRVLSKSGLI